jgi:diamine N-acetyltransferase
MLAAVAVPWYRAVVADGTPVGFVMVSWDAEAVRPVAELVRAEGATELLTSYVPLPGGPAGFYERLGFVPTGAVHPR